MDSGGGCVRFAGRLAIALAAALAAAPGVARAQLTVEDLSSGKTPTELFAALLGPGSGAEINACTMIGPDVAGGTFLGGASALGVDQGIALGSGAVTGAVGPNTLDDTTTDMGLPGDPQLDALVPGGYPTLDATVLDCSFVCPAGVTATTFDYVFSSEEYNEWTNTPFTDVFGFFLNGHNVALLPDGVTTVAINNVNGGNPQECSDGVDNDGDGVADLDDSDCTAPGDNIVGEANLNSAFFRNNRCEDPDGGAPCPIDVQADGLTTVLTAQGSLNPGVNTIRLGIADSADHILDSWVFIAGGSFRCAPTTCGNGELDPGEICDDGNQVLTDLCNNICRFTSCGDGVVQTPNGGTDGTDGFDEQCDDGNAFAGDGCAPGCIVEFCGDGVVNNVHETCDDGNTVSGDGCSSSCHLEGGEPACGDGVVNQPEEECDDGNVVEGDGCNDDCLLEYCGDGEEQPALGEQCDDGNTVSGDGCDSICKREYCGDGTLNNAPEEECDDGNTIDGDGCSGECRLEYCGDGEEQPGLGEQCDDGNTVSGDGCSATCQEEGGDPYCGDGEVNQPSESCDDGNNVSGDGCSADCTTEFCGDGTVQPGLGEQCDDGNTASGDGCSADCLVESTPFCGDGVVNQPSEECDDGNNVSGDGCGADCEVEPGPFCGDGVVNQVGEQCDDGNNVSGDGCGADCQVETPACTDGDGDGYAVEGGACGAVDCDDGDPAVHPGAAEIPGNAVDENCNGNFLCGSLAPGASGAASAALLILPALILLRRSRRG